MAPCTIDGAMNSGAAAAMQVEKLLNGPQHCQDPVPEVKTWSRTIVELELDKRTWRFFLFSTYTSVLPARLALFRLFNSFSSPLSL
jgi:hypothetical protein